MIILKAWKTVKGIYRNCIAMKMNHEQAYTLANSSKGLYAKAQGYIANIAIPCKVLETANKKVGRPGLVNPLKYYLQN